MSAVDKARAFQWVQAPPGDSLQPEAIGAVMEVTKWLKPSINVSRIGDSASVQAATRAVAVGAAGLSTLPTIAIAVGSRLVDADHIPRVRKTTAGRQNPIILKAPKLAMRPPGNSENEIIMRSRSLRSVVPASSAPSMYPFFLEVAKRFAV